MEKTFETLQTQVSSGRWEEGALYLTQESLHMASQYACIIWISIAQEEPNGENIWDITNSGKWWKTGGGGSLFYTRSFPHGQSVRMHHLKHSKVLSHEYLRHYKINEVVGDGRRQFPFLKQQPYQFAVCIVQNFHQQRRAKWRRHLRHIISLCA